MSRLDLRKGFVLLTLAVIGCNIDDSRDDATGSEPSVHFVPRILTAQGTAPLKTDSVLLRLVVDGMAPVEIGQHWDSARVRFRDIPVGKHWSLSVWGVDHPLGAARDTVWSGSDSGTLQQSGEQLHDARSTPTVVVVPHLHPPTVSYAGGLVPKTLAVGAELRFSAPYGAKIALATDTTKLSCSGTLSTDSIATRKIDSAMAGASVAIGAIACRDGYRASRPLVVGFSVAGLDKPYPTVTLDGAAVPATVSVGDSLHIDAPSGAKVAYSINGGDPSCDAFASLPSSLRIGIDSAMAGAKVELRTLSCWESGSSPVERISFVVPAVASSRPSITWKGSAVPGRLAVGSDLFLQASRGSRLAFTGNGDDPSCASAGSTDAATFHVDSSRADRDLQVKAVSCLDGKASEQNLVAFHVEALGKEATPQVAVPAAFDPASPSSTKLVWNSNVALTIGSGTNLLWNLKLVAGEAPTKDDWASLAVPDASHRTGAGSTLFVPQQMVAALQPGDTLFSVLAKALLTDDKGVSLDTALLRWPIIVPVAPAPAIAVARSLGQIVFSWPRSPSAALSTAWYRRGASADSVAARVVTSGARDSVVLAVAEGEAIHFGAQAIDSLTGRVSAPSLLDTAALRRPEIPVFTASNSDTVEGSVAIRLADATLAMGSTTQWKVGYSQDSAGIRYDAGSIDATGRWNVASVNQGTWYFGVQAVRDGLTRDSVIAVQVKRTKGSAPNKAANLRRSARDSSGVEWAWDKVEGRSYRVFVRLGGVFTAAADTSGADRNSTAGSVGRFRLDLAPGKSAAIAVVAMAGSDSAGGDAAPAFSELESALIPPVRPVFTATPTDTSAGLFELSVASFDTGSTWQYGIGTSASSLVWADVDRSSFLSLSSSGRATLSRSVAAAGAYWIGLRASRDGYSKETVLADPVLLKYTSLYTPAAPANLQLVTRTDNSLAWSWKVEPGHRYRLFWDSTLTSLDGLTDTSKVPTTNRINLAATATGWSITTYPGSRVSIALQTIVAPDSTRSASPLASAYGVALSAVAPIETIQAVLDASANKVNFTWSASSAAASYEYSVNGGSVASQGASLPRSLAVPYGTSTDVELKVRVVSADDVRSTWTSRSFHVPQNRGTTNLANWRVWIKGTTLAIVGVKPTFSGTAPDSVLVQLRTPTSTVREWRMAPADLDLFRYSKDVDQEIASNCAVWLQYRWTTGVSAGDSTSFDSYKPSFLKPSLAANGVVRVDSGLHYLSIDNWSAVASAAGWSPRFAGRFRRVSVSSFDIDSSREWIQLDGADVSYPAPVSGSGKYPLGLEKLRLFYVSDNGRDTSLEVEDTIAYGKPMVDANGNNYRTLQVGSLVWSADPLNGKLLSWFDATGLTKVPTDGDYTDMRGSCPDGWRLPNQNEVVSFGKALDPSYTGSYTSLLGPFWQTGFNLFGKEKIWTASVKDGGNVIFWSNTPWFNGNAFDPARLDDGFVFCVSPR